VKEVKVMNIMDDFALSIAKSAEREKIGLVLRFVFGLFGAREMVNFIGFAAFAMLRISLLRSIYLR